MANTILIQLAFAIAGTLLGLDLLARAAVDFYYRWIERREDRNGRGEQD